MGNGASGCWPGYYPFGWNLTHNHPPLWRKPVPPHVTEDSNRDDSQYYFRVQKGEEFKLNRDLIKE
jgi:hypothetical protein